MTQTLRLLPFQPQQLLRQALLVKPVQPVQQVHKVLKATKVLRELKAGRALKANKAIKATRVTTAPMLIHVLNKHWVVIDLQSF